MKEVEPKNSKESTSTVVHESLWLTALKDVVAGSVGGVFQCFLGHPLDTVKVRMQTSQRYTGLFHCILTTFREEKFRGFYSGVSSPLIGLTIYNAFMFFSYGISKRLVCSVFGVRPASSPEEEENLTVFHYSLAGCITGVLIAFIEAPMELVKIQLQVNGSSFKGLRHCASQALYSRGLRGAYQGLGSTIIRDIPANAAYFGSYELVKNSLRSENEVDIASWKLIVAGGVAGMMNWGASYPLDVIKSIVQAEDLDPAKRKYGDFISATKHIYRDFGIKGFFRGVVPCIIRAAPANAVCFLAYEYTLRLINQA